MVFIKKVVNSDAGDADHVGGNDWDALDNYFDDVTYGTTAKINTPTQYRDQTLKYRNPGNTFTLTARTPAITSDLDFLVGRSLYTFLVLIDGGLYKVIDCAFGSVVSSGSSPSTALQYALDNIPSTGGAIFINPGDYNLGATGLTLALVGNKPIDIGGCGPATKIRTSSGTAAPLTTDGTSSSQQYLKIHDILFQAGTSTVTTGRHCIVLGNEGPTTILDNVGLKYCDVGLNITDTNSVFCRNLKIQVCNTGVKSNLGPDTEPNALHFDNTFIGGATVAGFDLWSDTTGTGSVISINGGGIGESAVGIKISGNCREIVIGPNPFYMEADTDVNVWIAGTSVTTYPRNVNIENVRCSGTVGAQANMIKLDFCGYVMIKNCVAYNYSNAMILLNAATNPYKLLIEHPLLDGTTPYLIDTPSDNFQASGTVRNSGTVIGTNRVGVITSASASSLIEGSVVQWAGGNDIVTTTTTKDDTIPGVVMYPSSTTTGLRPCVVCVKGITQVNADAAVSTGDTLTTSATARKAGVNNSAVDPKIILGYAYETIGSAGLVRARIL